MSEAEAHPLERLEPLVLVAVGGLAAGLLALSAATVLAVAWLVDAAGTTF